MRPYWFILCALLPATEPFEGEEHNTDDLTVSSQMEMGYYQAKKKSEATQALKDELKEHPDLTLQTQREGTVYEHVVKKPILKDKYWARTGASIDLSAFPRVAAAAASGLQITVQNQGCMQRQRSRHAHGRPLPHFAPLDPNKARSGSTTTSSLASTTPRRRTSTSLCLRRSTA